MKKQINGANYKNFISNSSISLHRLLCYSLVLSVFMASFSLQAFSQKETFDIATYTSPKDFKKEANPGVVNYVHQNAAAGKFCVITMYANSASSGDAQKDFTNEWKQLVVTPYQAEANPKTETQKTADGWEVVTGAAAVKVDGNDVYIILTVISGFGKTLSVRSSLNDLAYTAQIDALMETMELNKTKKVAVNNNTPTIQTNAGAGAGKFGLMNYNAPAGWSEQKFSDGVVFKPLNLPPGEHLAIQIMQPLNASGTLEQAMEHSFEEATIMYKGTSMYQADGKYGKVAAHKSFNGWEYIRGKGGIKVNDGTQFGTEYGLELFIIKINNRFERVAIFESRPSCKPYYSRYYTSDRMSYRIAIEQLLFSLHFTDFNAIILKSGSAKGSGVIGVWQGVIQSTIAGVLRLETYELVLLDNGQVYFGPNFPIEGFDGLNTRIPAERDRRDWKTYTFSNGQGNLKMIFENIPFRTQADKIIITKNQTDWPFIKLPSVDGATFNGTYNLKAANNKIPSITFTTAGQFTDNGVIKELYHEYTDCLNPAPASGSGRYEVKDYTITFIYTDGRKIKIAFLGAEYNKNNPTPATLRMSYNEDPMTRQ